MLKRETGQRHNRRKTVGKMEIDRARKMPIFTSEAIDSLRLTDYMFLTPGPADIILSLVAASDFSLSSPLLSSSPDSMGEEYYIRGAPRIPPFVVVVSVTFSFFSSMKKASFVLFVFDTVSLSIVFAWLCEQFLQHMSQALYPPPTHTHTHR